jgi:CarboxypepD_reg-like domain/TonB-dependent Receptor Plug Domain
MRLLLMIKILAICCINSRGQSTLTGKITDLQGQTLPGASIYLLNTLDGASSDITGQYTLNTLETGNQTLVVSMIGYETINQPMVLENKSYVINFQLKEAVSELDEVVISAGTMEATNDRKVAVLRPLDIVTTAGAAGDIIGAIQTLPGTTRVGEQTGLFVRGGDASEANVMIDGMIVQNFFTSDVPGIAQRSRFSPFQFKGTSFSSGGYSVRYGQALSSVLELSTNDMPGESTVNAGINMSGIFGAGTKVFKKNSLEVTGSYINVAPFYNLANTNFDFYKAPEGVSGSARWVHKNGDKSIFKLLLSHGGFNSGTEIPDINVVGERFRFGINNRNTYSNVSYLNNINSKLYSFSAFSFGNNIDDVNFGNVPSRTEEWRLQGRTELGYEINSTLQLLSGLEIQRFSVSRSFDTFLSGFDETQWAVYTELEWKPVRKFGVKSGLRAEHSQLLDQPAFAPRLSAAYKVGKKSQVSVASGIFYQNPNTRYFLANKSADFQQSIHYIANYQWISDKQTFRIEGYYKSYDQLVRELNVPFNPNPFRFISGEIDNSGNGFAQGIDVFWRDRKLVKNLDYWISYSWVDTKRLFENFPTRATPTFISNHNLNVIAKYFIEPLKVNIAATYTFSTGRPYYDPNNSNFLADRVSHFENISLNLSYVTTVKKVFSVFYVGLDNIANRQNIFGYRYTDDGTKRFPIEPALYRSVFIGMNFSLSAFNRDEL